MNTRYFLNKKELEKLYKIGWVVRVTNTENGYNPIEFEKGKDIIKLGHFTTAKPIELKSENGGLMEFKNFDVLYSYLINDFKI